MTQRPKVVVFDYGRGNIHSAMRGLELAGADVELSADRRTVLEADGLLVPGVGSFRGVIGALRKVHGDALIDQRLAGGRPVLGICAGMQIFFAEGDEGGGATEGLGLWPGLVTKLDAPVLPHMGWNTVDAPADSTLFAGIQGERFYFVHSFAVVDWRLDPSPPLPQPRVTWAEHGQRFVAAVEDGVLSATQFHPEKSGKAGIRLLSNWLGSLARA